MHACLWKAGRGSDLFGFGWFSEVLQLTSLQSLGFKSQEKWVFFKKLMVLNKWNSAVAVFL